MSPNVRFSVESLNLFATLLSQVRLAPVSDSFEEEAKTVALARKELITAIESASNDNGSTD